MLWVYAVGITTIYCGKHMLWAYTVDDTGYAVDIIVMMWVTSSSTVYINVIHNISPTVYECIYTVDDMVWITLIQ